MNKKALTIIFFLLPLFTFAQSKKSIDGFLDIPFGSDSATVKAAIIANGGVRIDSLSNKKDMAFAGLTVSNRKVNICIVSFVNNKAFEADFYFTDFKDSQSLDYYDGFSADISAVYGKGKMTSDFGNLSNSQRIRRIRLGNASCSTLWKSKNKNTILLALAPMLQNKAIQIQLQYQNTDLMNLYLSKKRSDL
jgi:hypothetical protein